jgi:hypothetical protein
VQVLWALRSNFSLRTLVLSSNKAGPDFGTERDEVAGEHTHMSPHAQLIYRAMGQDMKSEGHGVFIFHCVASYDMDVVWVQATAWR